MGDSTGHNPNNRESSCIDDVQWKVEQDGMDSEQAQCEIKRVYPSCACLNCTEEERLRDAATWCWSNTGHNPNNWGSSCMDDVQWKIEHEGKDSNQAQCEIKQAFPSACACLAYWNTCPGQNDIAVVETETSSTVTTTTTTTT